MKVLFAIVFLVVLPGVTSSAQAEALIREHGPSAVIEAARRSISKLDDGNLKGQAVWQRVLESAEESQRREGQENGSAK